MDTMPVWERALPRPHPVHCPTGRPSRRTACLREHRERRLAGARLGRGDGRPAPGYRSPRRGDHRHALPSTASRSCTGRTRPATSPAAGSRSRSTAATAAPFLEGAARGWNEGFAQAPGWWRRRSAAATASRSTWPSMAAPPRSCRAALSSSRWRGPEDGGFNRAGLSAPTARCCASSHSEHGDLMHPALRVVDPRTGAAVAEQLDRRQEPARRGVVAGARRSAARRDSHERTGEEAPAIWDPATRCLDRSRHGLEGPAEVLDWWPDASAVLVRQVFEGRHRLFRLDLIASGELRAIEHPVRDRSRAPASVPTAASGTATRAELRRLGSWTTPARRCWCLQGAPSPPGRPYDVVALPEPARGRPCTASTSRPPATGPFPVLDAPARRPHLAGRGPVVSRGPVLRGRGVRGGARELSRVHRLRRGVARHPDRRHRRARSWRTSTRAWTTWWPGASPTPAERRWAAGPGVAT